MELRTKFITYFIIVLLFFGTATILFTKETMSENILEQFRLRGTSITRNLAIQSDDLILTEDIVGLQHLIEYTKKNEPEIEYIFIISQNGKVITHTFEGGFPVDLLKANTLQPNQTGKLVLIQVDTGVIYDFAFPVLEGKLGTVRVVMSDKHINQVLAQNIYGIIIFIIVILISGFIIAFLFANVMTKPIAELRDAVNEIGKGNLNARVEVRSDDEIGQLAGSFKKMAEDLQKTTVSKDYVDNIITSMFDALIVTTLEGTIKRVNKAACNMFGYASEELVGHPVDILFCGEFFHDSNILEKDSFSNMEKICAAKDGRRIPMLMSGSVIHDTKGNIQGIVYIAQDITDLKKAEMMRVQNEQLALASKTKSEFLANMSHELRTPLNSIIGFSELLKQNTNGELNEKHCHYVDNVLTSGKFLLNLINDILDLSKVEAGKLELVIEKISVPRIIDETLILIKEKAANHNLLLKKELDPSLKVIEADQQRIKQVLFNMLSNAVKFSKPEGGTITITVKKEDEMARFSVSDTGIGIREEDMDKLFRTFEQLDSGITKKYGGSGLGLAISKKLVELHGGQIGVESRYGEGSTFYFTIPLIVKKTDKVD
jgi:PAS domain S-box-containing protein